MKIFDDDAASAAAVCYTAHSFVIFMFVHYIIAIAMNTTNDDGGDKVIDVFTNLINNIFKHHI